LYAYCCDGTNTSTDVDYAKYYNVMEIAAGSASDALNSHATNCANPPQPDVEASSSATPPPPAVIVDPTAPIVVVPVAPVVPVVPVVTAVSEALTGVGADYRGA